mgnify:CR=1 FL=1
MQVTAAACTGLRSAYGDLMSAASFIEVLKPEQQRLPVVLSCPHAGLELPAALTAKSSLSNKDLLSTTDFGVRDLVEPAARDLGVPLVICTAARSFLDVNRAPEEIDLSLFDESSLRPPARNRSPRVLAGHGIIPTRTRNNSLIYGETKLSTEDFEARLDAAYHPFHQALAEQIEATLDQFDFCILLDCHSMPAMSPSASMSLRRDRNPFRLKQVPGEGEGLSTGSVDAVLGDRFGATCAKPVVLAILHRLWRDGLMVEWNRPYAGGHIIQRHADLERGVHAVQFELSRDLYLDSDLEPSARFAAVQSMVTSVVERLGCLDADILSESNDNSMIME